MADVITIEGGDGVPPEPNWRTIFGRVADRAAAAAYWRDIISELRSTEKLAVANAHSIKRLAVAYVMYDRSAKEVAKSGPVMKAPKTKTPTYNPWWTGNVHAVPTGLKPAEIRQFLGLRPPFSWSIRLPSAPTENRRNPPFNKRARRVRDARSDA